MTNEVLVGIDGSHNSLAALRWAARFAALTDRPLVLAHAWQHGRRLGGTSSTPHVDADGLEADVVENLRELATRERVEAHVSYRALRGPTAGSLLREATRLGAGLIVVGATGSGAARRALLGSVSRELTSCASHAIAVVPADHAPLARTFVAGVDGSDGSSRALRWAADMGRAVGGEVVAVHAFEYPVPGPSRDEAASLVDERRQRFEEEWCAPLRAASVPYQAIFEMGEARRVLRHVADSELPMGVVVGSRGLGVVSQRVLGSVARDLVRDLPCPTVIVPSVRDRIVWPSQPAN